MKIPTKFSSNSQVVNYLDDVAKQYNDGLLTFNEFLVATHTATKNRIAWQIEKAEATINLLNATKD